MLTTPLRKSHDLMKPANSSLFDLPAPSNLSYMWNFGSLLGLCLLIQILSGLLLATHYSAHIDLAFSSIAHITRDVHMGWMMRNLHANGASAFFLCLYLHMARGLFYGSPKLMETWNLGVIIFILSMATAFMGYLLPWGQMSFWGATVITNLFSAIPYIGKELVEWIWGGFGVSNATLTRFFTIHFILPFIITICVLLHLVFLHTSGSNNPLGLSSSTLKTPFHHSYTAKDLMGMTTLTLILVLMAFFYPNFLTDPENFIPANPLSTPTHIKPEWYFLWAYAILRSIPNKLGGVLSMFTAMGVFFMLPMLPWFHQHPNYSWKQTIIQSLAAVMVLLTWIGGSPVETPYDTIGAALTLTYFTIFLSLTMIKNKTPKQYQ